MRFHCGPHRGIASQPFVATKGNAASETFLGIVRYALDTSRGRTEFAVSVADDWQERGIGTALLSVLVECARGQGIAARFGWVLAVNEPVLRLARSCGSTLAAVPGDRGLLEVEIRVDGLAESTQA